MKNYPYVLMESLILMRLESVLEELHDNANLQNKISMYSLISQAVNDDSNVSYLPSSQQLIEAKPLRRSYRFWFANVYGSSFY